LTNEIIALVSLWITDDWSANSFKNKPKQQ